MTLSLTLNPVSASALAPAVSTAAPVAGLDPALIARLSSDYLAKGAFADDFQIDSAVVDGLRIDARLHMSAFGISPEDAGGFHLTAPTVFRMAAQLAVIAGHHLVGFDEKQIEVWLKEHSWKHRRPVRSPHDLRIQMTITDVRRAASQPNFIGLRFEVDVDDGAAVGWMLGYYDLSKHAHLTGRLLSLCDRNVQ